MIPIRTIILAAAMFAVSSPVAAQQTDPPAIELSERMAPLAGLVGEWRGSGWMVQQGGERSEFTSREIVTPRLSGAALLVEGQHRAPDGTIVHDAMAMLTWDEAADGYRFRSTVAPGRSGDFPLTVGEDGFVWSMDVPNGRIEYRASFTGDVWHETGSYTPEGGTAIPIFEMTLERQ